MFERIVYSDDEKKYYVIKEFCGVELERKCFRKFKNLYKYKNGQVYSIEGIENINLNKIKLNKYESTDIYKSSLIMKRIQALLEKNVIRIWDESIFDLLLPQERIE